MDREREAQYGRELDAANLARQGFVTPEALAGQREKVGGDVAKMALQSVSSMMNPAAPPPDAALLDRVLNTSGGMFRQGQEITVGGRKLVLPETDAQRGDRLDARQRGDQRYATQQAQAREDKRDAESRAFQLQRDEAQQKANEAIARINNQPTAERPVDIGAAIDADTRLYARTQIDDGLGGKKLPTPQEVAEYRAGLRSVYGVDAPAGGAGGSSMSSDFDDWMATNEPTTAERANPELYRKRYNAYLSGASASPAATPAQRQPSRQPPAGALAGDALSGLRPRPQPPRVVRGIPGVSTSDLELARSLYGKMRPDARGPMMPLFAPDTSARRRAGQ